MVPSWEIRDRLGSQWSYNLAGKTSNAGWVYRREILTKLQEMGVHHLRSYLLPRSSYVNVNGVQVKLQSAWMIDSPTYFHRWLEEMASKGMHFTFQLGRPYSPSVPARTPPGDYHPWWGTPQGLIDAARHYGPNCVAGEAPNEYDEPKVSYDIIDPWDQTLRDWLRRVGPLWEQTFGAGTPYLGPSFGNAEQGTPSQLGDVSSYTDRKNAHPYCGNKVYRTASLDRDYSLLQVTNPGQPMWATEFGVAVTPTPPPYWAPATERDQGLLLSKQYLTMLKWGVRRSYLFNFYDARASSQPFSLLLGDPTNGFYERPAYRMFRKILSLCDSSGGGTAPPAPTLSLSGAPADLKTLIAWNKDGTYLLFLWREAALGTSPVRLSLSMPGKGLKCSYDLVSGGANCPKAQPSGTTQTIWIGDEPLAYKFG